MRCTCTARRSRGACCRRRIPTPSVGALLFVAPMLIRRQHVRLEIDFPLNRIRTHLEALRDLGIDIVSSSNAVEFKAATLGLQGHRADAGQRHGDGAGR